MALPHSRAVRMGDGSLAAAVWDGAIPLCLSLDEHEVAAPQTPPSLFTLVPRHAYLPMLSDAAFAHFQDVLPPGDNELWFDAAGVPLKWQLPCGVLHDLLGGELPWRLRVHFRAYPEGMLTRCSGPEAVRGHLFNSLKVSALRAWRGVAMLTQTPSAARRLAISPAAAHPRCSHCTRRRRRTCGRHECPAFCLCQESADVSPRRTPQGLLDRDFARYKRGAAALSASSRTSRCDARASRNDLPVT